MDSHVQRHARACQESITCYMLLEREWYLFKVCKNTHEKGCHIETILCCIGVITMATASLQTSTGGARFGKLHTHQDRGSGPEYRKGSGRTGYTNKDPAEPAPSSIVMHSFVHTKKRTGFSNCFSKLIMDRFDKQDEKPVGFLVYIKECITTLDGTGGRSQKAHIWGQGRG